MTITYTAGTPNIYTITAGSETTSSLYTFDKGGSGGNVITRSGTAGNYTYTFASGRYRITVNYGCTFSMESSDTLAWTLSAAEQIITTIGEFNAVENCEINGSSSYEADIVVYGKFDCHGTEGNPVLLKNLDEIHFYNSYGTIGSDWDWVSITDLYGTTTSSNIFNCPYSVQFKNIPCSFDHVTITGADDCVPFNLSSLNALNWTFNYVVSTNVYSHFAGNMPVAKFSNCEFSASYYYPFTQGGTCFPQNYQTSRSARVRNKLHTYNQPKITFDTCLFDNNYNSSTTYNTLYLYASVVKYKDCTFSNASYGLSVYNDSTFLLQGTTTNTCTTPVHWGGVDGTLLHVWALTLTVKDIDGNGIPNATVFVNQSQDYESHMFLTNSSGQIKDCHGDDPVFAEKEQTAASTYVDWSDSIASGRYHSIHVYADGYQPWTKKVEFTSNKEITATLYPIHGIRALPQP